MMTIDPESLIDDRPRQRGDIVSWRDGYWRWRFRVYTGASSWLTGRARFRVLIPGRATRMLLAYPNRGNRRAIDRLNREL